MVENETGCFKRWSCPLRRYPWQAKRPPKDFPLSIEIQSFETRPAPDTPINYRGTTLVNIQNTEVIIHANIEQQSYVLSCTTAEIGCASIVPVLGVD